MNMNMALCRLLLKTVTEEVRHAHPNVKLRDAWVWKAGRDHWEFHFGEFFWHGSADNAYDARAKGWSAYLNRSKESGQ